MPTLLRPLTVGEIADRAVSLYRREFRLLFTIAFFTQLPIYLGTKGYNYLLFALAGEEDAPAAKVLPLVLLWPFLLLGAWFLGLVATGALTWAASTRYLDEVAGLGVSLWQGVRKVLQLFITMLMSAVAIMAALFAGLIPGFVLIAVLVPMLHPVLLILLVPPFVAISTGPGLFVFLRLLFASYVPTSVMMENQWGPWAMARSWRLMGFRSPTWKLGEWSAYRATALFLLVFALWGGVLSLTSIPYGAVLAWYGAKHFMQEGEGGGIDPETVQNPASWGIPLALLVPLELLNVAGQALMNPFLVCLIVVFYYDLRVRKEGFDFFRELRPLPAPGPP